MRSGLLFILRKELRHLRVVLLLDGQVLLVQAHQLREHLGKHGYRVSLSLLYLTISSFADTAEVMLPPHQRRCFAIEGRSVGAPVCFPLRGTKPKSRDVSAPGPQPITPSSETATLRKRPGTWGARGCRGVLVSETSNARRTIFLKVSIEIHHVLRKTLHYAALYYTARHYTRLD